MCRECYDVAWQIVFSDLWKKNIFELVHTKRADWKPMFHWWCLVIKYLVILSKFELVKNFEIKLKNLTTKRCINDLANKPWLNEEMILFLENTPAIDHPGSTVQEREKLPTLKKVSSYARRWNACRVLRGGDGGGFGVRRPPECGRLQQAACAVHSAR